MSIISVAFITFVFDWSAYYGVDVPDQYNNSFNSYADIKSEYSQAEEAVRTGEIDSEGQDIAVFKNSITAARLLGNVGKFANTALNDLSKIVGLPPYLSAGVFLIVVVLILAATIAFFTRGAMP